MNNSIQYQEIHLLLDSAPHLFPALSTLFSRIPPSRVLYLCPRLAPLTSPCAVQTAVRTAVQTAVQNTAQIVAQIVALTAALTATLQFRTLTLSCRRTFSLTPPAHPDPDLLTLLPALSSSRNFPPQSQVLSELPYALACTHSLIFTALTNAVLTPTASITGANFARPPQTLAASHSTQSDRLSPTPLWYLFQIS